MHGQGYSYFLFYCEHLAGSRFILGSLEIFSKNKISIKTRFCSDLLVIPPPLHPYITTIRKFIRNQDCSINTRTALQQ